MRHLKFFLLACLMLGAMFVSFAFAMSWCMWGCEPLSPWTLLFQGTFWLSAAGLIAIVFYWFRGKRDEKI